MTVIFDCPLTLELSPTIVHPRGQGACLLPPKDLAFYTETEFSKFGVQLDSMARAIAEYSGTTVIDRNSYPFAQKLYEITNLATASNILLESTYFIKRLTVDRKIHNKGMANNLAEKIMWPMFFSI